MDGAIMAKLTPRQQEVVRLLAQGQTQQQVARVLNLQYSTVRKIAMTARERAGATTTAHLMALAALFIVTLAETGRVPVDNPATHLELTMIHEAMLLEYSGRYLALMEWAAGIKLLVFLTLIVNVFAPWGIATSLAPSAIAVGLLVYLGKVAALALVIGVIESMFAKLRLFRVPEMLGAAFILSLLALVFFYTLKG